MCYQKYNAKVEVECLTFEIQVHPLVDLDPSELRPDAHQEDLPPSHNLYIVHRHRQANYKFLVHG
jgi:hypothetical protein